MEALARLIGWKLTLHGVPVQGQVTVTSAGGESNRYRSGTPVTLERISGHRDGDSTSCPGEVLYGQLADLRARAARYTGPLAVLTMYTSKTVRGVKPSEVGGELRFSDGSPAGGLGVDVEIQAGGSAWTRYTGALVNPDGSWVTSISLPYSANVRAVFPGDASRGRMESKAVAVKLVPSLRIALVLLAAAPAPGAARGRHDEPGDAARHRALRAPGGPPLGARAAQADRGRRRRVLDDRAPARQRALPRVGHRRRASRARRRLRAR